MSINMQSKNDVTFIAGNKKNLSQFILNLCGFTLNKAGLSSQAYAFHLHIAFRRQRVLQSQQWEQLVKSVTQTPLYWDDEASKRISLEISALAQCIVNDVQEAISVNWEMRLLKTGFLNTLDKAGHHSKNVIKLIKALPVDDQLTANYLETLKAHRHYLDSLFDLPFVLEKCCLTLTNNSGVNFLPRKSTEMLTAILNTLHSALPPNILEETLLDTLQLAIKISMPDLPLDGSSILIIREELLPCIQKVLQNNLRFETAKKRIYPESDLPLTTARKKLLAMAGVHLDSLQDIVTTTLMAPLREMDALAAGLQGMAVVAAGFIDNPNPVEKIKQIGLLFRQMEKIAEVAEQFPSDWLPSWLNEANDYYQAFSEKVAEVEWVTEEAETAAHYGLERIYNQFAWFIPDAVKAYFSSQDAYARVLSTLHADVPAHTINKVLAFLDIYELMKASGLNKPLNALFFDAYIQALQQHVDCILSYEEFEQWEEHLASIDLERSLSLLLHELANVQSAQENPLQGLLNTKTSAPFDVLILMHRLSRLESEWDEKSEQGDTVALVALLEELEASMQTVNDLASNPTIQAFNKEFLEPASQRLLSGLMHKQCILRLEGVIGHPDPVIPVDKAYSDYLPAIYSKLIQGLRLSVNDYEVLRKSFANDPSFTAMAATCLAAEAVERLLPPDQRAYQICLTPHQQLIQHVKEDALPIAKEGLIAIIAGLDKQLETCNAFLTLCVKDSNLDQLCQNKVDYIDSIKAIINELVNTITDDPDSLAIELDRLIHGEGLDQAKASLEKMSLMPMVGRLLRFVWHVLPSDTSRSDDNFLNNLLLYYFKGSVAARAYQAQQRFYEGLKKHAVPELMPMLGDPLQIANMMPREDIVMNALLQQLRKCLPKPSAILSQGSKLLQRSTRALLNSMNQEILSKILPYPFLAVITAKVLHTKEFQSAINALFSKLAEEYKGIVEDNAAKLVESAKNRLYLFLSIEVQKSVEMNAYRYALNPDSASDEERDAFALYYLQYLAIKQQNTAVEPAKCIAFLFKCSLENPPQGMDVRAIVDSLASAFAGLDKNLRIGQETEWTKTLNLLQFLIQYLDFSDQDNETPLRLVLINRLLLMFMETSSLLTCGNQAFRALSRILEKYHKAAATFENTPSSEEDADDGFIVLGKTSPGYLMRVLAPAQKKIGDRFLRRLIISINKTSSHIQNAVTVRQRMLADNQLEPQLGRSKIAVEYDKSKNNPPRRIVLAAYLLFEIISLLSFWYAVITPFLGGGNAVMQSLLTVFGIAGVVGSSASIVGLAVFAALALIRLSYKLAKEIWSHRKAFNEIAHNEQYSLAYKIGFITLVLLKCMALAILKTIFTDYIVTKVSTLLAGVPLQLIRNAFMFYPSIKTVREEKEVLENLNNQLGVIKKLINVQIQRQNLEDIEKLDAAFKKLETAMEDVTEKLGAAIGKNDVRDTSDYRQTLQYYKNAYQKTLILFKSLSKLSDAAKVISQGLPSPGIDNDQEKEPERQEEAVTTNGQGRIDLDAYFKEAQLKQGKASANHFFQPLIPTEKKQGIAPPATRYQL